MRVLEPMHTGLPHDYRVWSKADVQSPLGSGRRRMEIKSNHVDTLKWHQLKAGTSILDL